MPAKRICKSHSASSNLGREKNSGYLRVAMMGPAGVGKSSIIQQFMYDNFANDYIETVEELHRGEYDMGDVKLTLDILDTAGAYNFPAMRDLVIATSNAFILVYSVDDSDSFNEITRLRQTIIDKRSTEDVPIVVVGNKTDKNEKERAIRRETAECVTCIEWNNGFVEASAKNNENIVAIFQEIFRQSKLDYNLSPAVKRRRQSLHMFPSMPDLQRKSNDEGQKSKTRRSIVKGIFTTQRSSP